MAKAKKDQPVKTTLKKVWHFIWEDDSIWSWIVNIILAFVLIKFIVYPTLSLALGTSFPIVAVVSSSMEHNADFDTWWDKSEAWYVKNDITKEDMTSFPFSNGFRKGDIMILRGAKPKDIKIGDIIVFKSKRPDPIIHRIVAKWQEEGIFYFQTKGDNYRTNPDSIKSVYLDETKIHENQVIGRAVFPIPFLGYIKIGFVELIRLILG